MAQTTSPNYLSIDQIFGLYISYAEPWHITNATDLVSRVNKLLSLYVAATGNPVETSAATGCVLSGPNAGFRPKTSKVGAANSSHKEGRAVDLADRTRKLKDWLMLPTHKSMELCGLYMEHPVDTPTWCHLTTRKPPSGNRVFHA